MVRYCCQAFLAKESELPLSVGLLPQTPGIVIVLPYARLLVDKRVQAIARL